MSGGPFRLPAVELASSLIQSLLEVVTLAFELLEPRAIARPGRARRSAGGRTGSRDLFDPVFQGFVLEGELGKSRVLSVELSIGIGQRLSSLVERFDINGGSRLGVVFAHPKQAIFLLQRFDSLLGLGQLIWIRLCRTKCQSLF